MNEDLKAVVDSIREIKDELSCDLDQALDVYYAYLDDRAAVRAKTDQDSLERVLRLEEKPRRQRA